MSNDEQAIEDELDELCTPLTAIDSDEAREFVKKVENRNGLSVNIQAREDRAKDLIWDGATAMYHAGIDPDIWEVDRCETSTYQVVISAKKSHTEKDTQYQMVRIRLVCKRRFKESLMNAVDRIAQRAHKKAYKLTPVRYKKPKKDISRLVVGLTDHHFAKLCYKPEVLSSYDLKSAEKLWTLAIRAAVDKCTGKDISQIILPIGNDMCHTDTRAMTTESGTPMDVDTRYEKMSEVAEESLMLAIEELRQVAPVDVLWVPGNHDYVTSRWLCRCAHHAFKSAKHVTVDTSDCPVKYRDFGRCLLGFAHGNAPNQRALMKQMPVHVPDKWARATECREWITGHFHKDMFREQPSTDEQAGMTFRILPSLCGTDSYHFRGGWSLSKKRTQTLIYSEKWGLSSIESESAEKLLA